MEKKKRRKRTIPKKFVDRNEKIREMWESRAYSKAEIGRRMGITRERVRAILDRLDVSSPYMSDEFDWKTLKKIRRALRIRHIRSTHKQLENGTGIYEYPRVSTTAVKYFAYILDQVLVKLDRLDKLVDELKIPYE